MSVRLPPSAYFLTRALASSRCPDCDRSASIARTSSFVYVLGAGFSGSLSADCKALDALRNSRNPFPTARPTSGSLPGPKIISDNFRGAYEGTRHLIEQGFKRIGIIAGFMTSEAYVSRLDGYKQALSDMGMEIDEDIIFYGSIVQKGGYEAGKQAIERGCDAIYSTGDYTALGALQAAREAGLRVPEDFGIVGTADERFSALITPSLSSMAQHPYEMGRRAAQAFITSLKPGAKVGEVVVPMELIKRASSKRHQLV